GVEVTPNDEVVVEVILETGTLRLTNRTGESVRLYIDGIVDRTVEADNQIDISGLVVGVHSLRAVAADSSREYLRTVNVSRDQELTWDLSAANGLVSLKNLTGEVLTLTIDDTDRGTLATGKTIGLDNVPLGLRVIRATGSTTGYTWSAEIPVTAGHAAAWTLRNDVSTARITNRLSESIELRLDGERLRDIPPGVSVFIDELRGSKPRFTAFTTVSHQLLRPPWAGQKASTQVTPARSVVWEIATPQGQLRVVNETSERVMVYADQRPLGFVEPEMTVVFTQVPPGERLVEARLGSGNIISDRVGVSAEATAQWRVAMATGTLVVVNETAEAIAAPPHLVPQGAEIMPGARASYTVATGERVFHFIGRRSGQSYRKQMTVFADEEIEWGLQTLMGVLHVFNRSLSDQTIQVDGLEPFVVRAGKDSQRAIEAGVHRLVAVAQGTGTAREGTVVVRHGSVHAWEVRPQLGYLRVLNRTHEELVLRVDGMMLGQVDPQDARTWGPWPTQTYNLVAQGTWSRALYEVAVTLGPGGVEAWEILPARGAVHAQNLRSEAVRLLIDRKEVAVLKAGGEFTTDVSIGPHIVELIGVETLSTFRFGATIRPDRAYTATAPEGPALLEITNQTPDALSVRAGDVSIGTAPGGVTVRLPLSVLGEQTLFADDPTGKRRYQRRLTITGDRVIRWIIRP
ncbi:MAG: hypothetical protein ACI9OJ_003048, partial [Myxococcota bacterium]